MEFILPPDLPDDLKSCSKCKIKRHTFLFSKNKKICDICKEIKWCKNCGLVDHRDSFIVNRRHCKICYNDVIQKNNRKNADKSAVSFYNANYKKENKDMYKTYMREYVKDRRKNDPVFKLKNKVSQSIFLYLKKKNICKNGSIIDNLQYDFETLRIYLEEKFEPWMNWSNHGNYRKESWDDKDPSTWKWQLDHIIPHSDFNYISMEDPSFKNCWALSNLRPLSAKQNQLDGCTKVRHKKKEEK